MMAMDTETIENLIFYGEFSSYDAFQKAIRSIKDKYLKDQVNEFVNILYIYNEYDFIEMKIINNYRVFINFFWFYRWLLSEGNYYVETKEIYNYMRNFLYKLDKYCYVVDEISEDIEWARMFAYFGESTEFERCKPNENSRKSMIDVTKRIIYRFIDNINMRGSQSVIYIIDAWIVLHVLIRECFFNEMSSFEEEILLNYISLINNYPELEHIFGVAIEMDLEKILKEIRGVL